MSSLAPLAEADIDRVRELVSIGAGHAATALAGLTGRTCEMRVPTVRLLADLPTGPGPAGDADVTGVLFELEGGTGGVLALLLPGATRERLLEHLLGPRPQGARSGSAAESALREVGNILASHAANAVSEMLGEAVLPSVPLLAFEDGPAALASLLALRHNTEPALRIESEIFDRDHELCGTLVLVPDKVRRVAPTAGF